jgi:uncharacterized protein YndB with AHSA1/START domain
MLYRSVTIATSIDYPVKQVYEFLAEPLNLPTWTVAIERIEHRRGSDWAATTPQGEVTFRYHPRNEYGVLDFAMWRPGEAEGEIIPARVFANGDGTEMTLTLYQRPGITDEAFDSEVEWTRNDILTLKTLLESRKPS